MLQFEQLQTFIQRKQFLVSVLLSNLCHVSRSHQASNRILDVVCLACSIKQVRQLTKEQNPMDRPLGKTCGQSIDLVKNIIRISRPNNTKVFFALRYEHNKGHDYHFMICDKYCYVFQFILCKALRDNFFLLISGIVCAQTSCLLGSIGCYRLGLQWPKYRRIK